MPTRWSLPLPLPVGWWRRPAIRRTHDELLIDPSLLVLVLVQVLVLVLVLVRTAPDLGVRAGWRNRRPGDGCRIDPCWCWCWHGVRFAPTDDWRLVLHQRASSP